MTVFQAFMRAFVASVFIGYAAYWLAIGVGIAHWRQWEPGDATDIGVFAGMGVLIFRWSISTEATHDRG